MSNLFSIVLPLIIFCIILFVVCMIYTSIVDKITASVKKLLGINKKSQKNWHRIDEFEEQENNDKKNDFNI